MAKISKLSQSLEDYLEMVHIQCLANKGIAHVKDIAQALSVKMPSVNKAMNELKKLGLVSQEPYTGIVLSPLGKKMAAKILGRHFLLKSFLIRLGVPETIANEDACKMEHILSPETLSCISTFVKGETPEVKED
ncbi:MAG: DtxR family transcriptional regulator [Fibrobacteraceae bacterium]|nr:DtxR family transcriptional regulator [Fibrobacteraceae bacterium]